MADDVVMTPVEAVEPPKVDPLATKATPNAATLKLDSVVRKPMVGGLPTGALKPGLKLPPKPGLATGIKLPPKPDLATGLKLPPKPGMKLPTVPLTPGVKLPPKPVIRKPGATVSAVPLPKPVAPLSAAKPAEPAVEAKAVDRADTAPAVSTSPKPLEALKSVTQKLKGITQAIPQQAILRKTGIISDGAMSEAQKEAAKHKTARISLSDAMGVAPVKDEKAPMKTIRIKRPVDISGAARPLAPVPASDTASEPAPRPETAAEAEAASTITQRKTLKISRPGGAVRPSGKFGVKRPSQATTVVKAPESGEAAPAASAGNGETPVADIADIPDMSPVAPMPAVSSSTGESPAWLTMLSTVVQAAACVAIGALAWFLYQNTQIAYF